MLTLIDPAKKSTPSKILNLLRAETWRQTLNAKAKVALIAGIKTQDADMRISLSDQQVEILVSEIILPRCKTDPSFIAVTTDRGMLQIDFGSDAFAKTEPEETTLKQRWFLAVWKRKLIHLGGSLTCDFAKRKFKISIPYEAKAKNFPPPGIHHTRTEDHHRLLAK